MPTTPILQFSNLKCCIKAKEPYKTPLLMVSGLNGVLVLMHYFKKYFKPHFFYFKGILQHFEFDNWRIRKLENSIFDVTNRAINLEVEQFTMN